MSDFLRRLKRLGRRRVRCRSTILGAIVFVCICLNLYLLIRSSRQRTTTQAINTSDNHEVPLPFAARIQRTRYNINCSALLDKAHGNEAMSQAQALLASLRAQNNAHNHQARPRIALVDDANFIFNASMCAEYRRVRGFDRHQQVDKSELDFPLAFSILTFEHVEQLERLVRAIYRPHNLYCIHVDGNSGPVFRRAVQSIATCLFNVFVSASSEPIVYASFSRLQADLNCMHELLERRRGESSVEWKYVLNMASSEYPLRTNGELVRILRMYNGANEIEILKFMPNARVQYSWRVAQSVGNTPKLEPVLQANGSKMPKQPAPHGFRIVKGLAYCALGHSFVEYVLRERVVSDLLAWGADTYSPDEWFWATIQFNTQFKPPGGFFDRDNSSKRLDTLARFAGWGGEYKCKGVWRHGVCVLSLADLPEIIQKPHFAVNKLMLNYDPVAYQCLEEWLDGRLLGADKSPSNTLNMHVYCQHIMKRSVLSDCKHIE